jgi:hypothetical protein
VDSQGGEEAIRAGSEAVEGGSYAPVDFAELWLMADRAHSAIQDAALKKDWLGAMGAAMVLKSCAYKMEDWFEAAHLNGTGK